jgi:hypothetical protein
MRASRTAVVPITSQMPLLNTPNHIRAAVATLWTLTDFEGETEGMQLLDIFLTQAQLRIPQIAFGHNLGKKLVRSVMREVTARAESCNLASTAPLQPERIAGFLSELPVNQKGERCKLPTVKLL